MANFDFQSLNSTDLENLSCDLLNAQEYSQNSKIVFKTFAEGKDKGIDFLYPLKDNPYYIVGQVKHYYKSGYEQLRNVLKNDELKKVIKLNPNRYIITTSVDLGLPNQEELKNIFKPYLEISDIYGKKDLNRLLDKFPQVLTNNFKLWYSSSHVLQQLLNYRQIGRSNEFEKEELQKKLRVYVPTPILERAKLCLDKNSFVIITGEPGVGKTTTAELLVYELIKDGYKLAYLYDDIKETEDFLKDDDSKQVFYFDDFLGHNSVEMIKAKGAETFLLKTLRRISNLNNKKFIFTTRTFIFNGVVEESDRLQEFNVRAKESLFQLQEYTVADKTQLLKNHVEESEVSIVLKEVLQNSSIIDFIVYHPNFSPRSIQFITTAERVGNFAPKDFENFIKQSFDVPSEIWKYAYEEQINDFDRFLLNTMVSFGDSVDKDSLEDAFMSRIDFEVRFNNYVRPHNAFNHSFRKLEKGFIVQEFVDDSSQYKFINPSLVDFLMDYIRNNPREIDRISGSANYLQQLTTRIYPLHEPITRRLIPKKVEEKLLHEYEIFIKQETHNSDLLVLSMILYHYVQLDKSEELICTLLKSLVNFSFMSDDSSLIYDVKYFIEKLESKKIIGTIRNLGIDFFIPLILAEGSIVGVLTLMDIIVTKYEPDLPSLIDSYAKQNISDTFTDLLDEEIEEAIEELLTYSLAQDFVDEKEDEIEKLRLDLLSFGISTSPNFSRFRDYDWNEIGDQNYFSEQMEKDD